MSSAAQVKANRANAHYSTGPRTQRGQEQSKANAVSHGLRSSRETLFAAHLIEQKNYDALQAQLRAELLPTGTTEELAFASFQVQRAQAIEVKTQNHFLENPENQNAFLQMERTAAKSLDELRKLQADRFAAAELILELETAKLPSAVSRALSLTAIRKKFFQREDPLLLGIASNASRGIRTNQPNSTSNNPA